MKLLFDENLSPRLVNFLSTPFLGSVHVRDVGLAQADDEAIWTYAKDNGFAIVSKDSDFQQRICGVSKLRGFARAPSILFYFGYVVAHQPHSEFVSPARDEALTDQRLH